MKRDSSLGVKSTGVADTGHVLKFGVLVRVRPEFLHLWLEHHLSGRAVLVSDKHLHDDEHGGVAAHGDVRSHGSIHSAVVLNERLEGFIGRAGHLDQAFRGDVSHQILAAVGKSWAPLQGVGLVFELNPLDGLLHSLDSSHSPHSRASR